MPIRVMPGSDEELIYHRLLPKVSMQGRIRSQEDFDAVARLAVAIQAHGQRDPFVQVMAEALGLDPRFLPHRRES